MQQLTRFCKPIAGSQVTWIPESGPHNASKTTASNASNIITFRLLRFWLPGGLSLTYKLANASHWSDWNHWTSLRHWRISIGKQLRFAACRCSAFSSSVLPDACSAQVATEAQSACTETHSRTQPHTDTTHTRKRCKIGWTDSEKGTHLR